MKISKKNLKILLEIEQYRSEVKGISTTHTLPSKKVTPTLFLCLCKTYTDFDMEIMKTVVNIIIPATSKIQINLKELI
jgi:hypothetical protein